MDKTMLENRKNVLLKRMIDYLVEFEGEGYTQKDVKKVEKILENYFSKMEKESKKIPNNYKEIVKETVILLNNVNEKCDSLLIETDQREDICDYIINTAIFFKFINNFEDITEEWREW